MKTFIGIGSDHEKYVHDEVESILSNEKPECIALEEHINPYNIGEPLSSPRCVERKKELSHECLDYTVSKKAGYPAIKVNDLFVYGAYSPRIHELDAGFSFAIRNGIPFYLVDFSIDFPDTIQEFKDGKFCLISLKGKTTYQKHPDEFMKFRGKIITGVADVDARNRFTSDSINYLLENYDSLAHIGGCGHFDSSTEPDPDSWNRCVLHEGLELQYLVRADKKKVYNLVDNTALEF